MLTPSDDYPIHQTALPLAHTASADPNHYDRFWFNGYTEDFYFAAGMAVYPNRGIIDGACGQRDVGVDPEIGGIAAHARGPQRLDDVDRQRPDTGLRTILRDPTRREH